jgi:hypothetical protein
MSRIKVPNCIRLPKAQNNALGSRFFLLNKSYKVVILQGELHACNFTERPELAKTKNSVLYFY